MKTYCFSCGHPNDSLKSKSCSSCGGSLTPKPTSLAINFSKSGVNKASSPKRGKPVRSESRVLSEDDEEFWESDEFENHDYESISRLNYSFEPPKKSFKLGDLIKIQDAGQVEE